MVFAFGALLGCQVVFIGGDVFFDGVRFVVILLIDQLAQRF
jgi:hypothetical protein